MTKNYAHRGFSGKYPENTMLAFKKAIELGCDGIELDVQLSKDGEVMIMHDEKLERTTNGKGYLKDYTSSELKKFNASALFENLNETIPTLREYFQLVKDTSLITIIELKTTFFEYIGIEEKVNDLIKEFKLQNKVILSSFNHLSMQRMKKLNPQLPCALLESSWLIKPGKYVQEAQMEYLHSHYSSISLSTLQEIHSHNVGVNVWTVNEKQELEDMLNLGVEGIITNFPDVLKDLINKGRLT